MSVVRLGPRASLLLGMLCKPMTTLELYDLLDDAAEILDDLELDGMFDSSPRLALDALRDGGVYEIRKQLVRLERMGLVTRAVCQRNEPHLWWRLRTPA